MNKEEPNQLSIPTNSYLLHFSLKETKHTH